MKIGDESFEGVPASRPNSVLSDETVSAYENEHVMMSVGETIPLVELLSQTINPLANKKSTITRRRSSYLSSGRGRKHKRQTSSATVNDDKKTTSGTVQRTSSDADGSVSMIGSGRVQKARRTGGKPILLSCSAYRRNAIRSVYFTTLTRKELFENTNYLHILDFIKEIGIYKQI